MPKKGEYATHCAYGHDLRQPGARRPPRKGGRGLGDCSQCVIDRHRAAKGSTKTGPANRFKINDPEREKAVQSGLVWCPKCKQGKRASEFNKDSRTPNGLNAYCRECRRALKALVYERNREAILLQVQARNFGVTVEFLLDLRARQNNLCAICRKACLTGRSLAVDHDHETGVVRGLLCANCNRALGLLCDSPEVIAKAYAYLLPWKGVDGASAESVQSSRLQ